MPKVERKENHWKPDNVTVTLSLKKDTIDKARRYAEKRGINVSGTVNLALSYYLEKYD